MTPLLPKYRQACFYPSNEIQIFTVLTGVTVNITVVWNVKYYDTVKLTFRWNLLPPSTGWINIIPDYAVSHPKEGNPYNESFI